MPDNNNKKLVLWLATLETPSDNQEYIIKHALKN